MMNIHEPASKFVSHLEWQVRTTLSRHDRFSQPASRPAGRPMKLVALIVISAFLGAAGVTATGMVQESKTRDYFLSRIDMQIQLAEVQLASLRARVAKVTQQYENGLVGESVSNTTKHGLRVAELGYVRLQLDREEIVLTGQEPLQSLSAPLVNGRDFVTERLNLELSVAEDDARLAESISDRERNLGEQGLLTALEERQQALVTIPRMQHLNILRAHHSLRQRFLSGELTAEQVEREAMATEAQLQFEHQKLSVETAREHLERSSELYEQGMIQEVELRRAQFELQKQEIELQNLLTSIEHFKSGGDSSLER